MQWHGDFTPSVLEESSLKESHHCPLSFLFPLYRVCKTPVLQKSTRLVAEKEELRGGGCNIRAKTSSELMNLHCNLSVSGLFPVRLNHVLPAQTSISFLSLPWGIFCASSFSSRLSFLNGFLSRPLWASLIENY